MNLPCSLEAKDVIEVKTVGRTVNIGKTFGVSKTVVVIIKIHVVQEQIGLVDGVDTVTTKGFDESILMSTIGAFDTSFGLRRMSVNDLDSEFL